MMRLVLLCCISAISWAQLQCQGHVNITMNVGEKKILNGYGQWSILSLQENISSVFGQFQVQEFVEQNHVAFEFDTLIQLIPFNNQDLTTFTRLALLGSKSDNYVLQVLDVPAYNKSGDTPLSQSFNLQSMNESNFKCYSAAFLNLDQIVVDCSIEDTPLDINNMFLLVNMLDSQITTYSNLNVGQFNEVIKRQILITPYNQQNALIRTYLEVDENHANLTTIEIFYLNNPIYDKDSFILQSSFPVTQAVDSGVWQDALYVLTTTSLETLLPNSTRLSVPLPCIGKQLLFVQDLVYFSCMDSLYSYNGSSFIQVYQASSTIAQISESSTGIVIATEFQSLLNNVTVDGMLKGIGTDTLLRLNQDSICIGVVPQGYLTLKPIIASETVIQLVVRNTKTGINCVRELGVRVIEACEGELVNVQSKLNLDSITSEDVNWGTPVGVDQYVIGPDVHLLSGDGTIEVEFMDYTEAILDLPQSSQVLKIVKYKELYKIFVLDGSGVNIQMCENATLNMVCVVENTIPINSSVERIEIQQEDESMIVVIQEPNAGPKFYRVRGTVIFAMEGIVSGTQWILSNSTVVSYQQEWPNINVYSLGEQSIVKTGEIMKQSLQGILGPITDWCISANAQQIIITQGDKIVQLQFINQRWYLGDVFIKESTNTPLFCQIIMNQYVFVEDNVFHLYGLNQGIYHRGMVNLTNFNFTFANQLLRSDNGVYLINQEKVMQLNVQAMTGMQEIVTRILQFPGLEQFVPFSGSTVEHVFIRQAQMDSKLMTYMNKKQMVIGNPNKENYVEQYTLNLNFTNSLLSEISIQTQVYLGQEETPLIKKQNQTTIEQMQDYNQTEIYFNSDDIFQGPISSLSIDKNSSQLGIKLVNRIHLIQNLNMTDLVDFIRCQSKNGSLAFDIGLTNDSIVVTNQFNQTITTQIINVSDETKLEKLYFEDDYLTIIETNKGIPSTSYRTNIFESYNVSFISSELQVDCDQVIKYILQNSTLFVLGMQDQYPIFYVSDLNNDTLLVNLTDLGFQNIVDFDMINNTVYILDGVSGIGEITIVTSRILLQSLSASLVEYPLTDRLQELGETIFTDTRYNGIAVTGNKTLFISTNNAQNYQIQLNDPFEILSTFTRMNTLPSVPQSVVFHPSLNTTSVAYMGTQTKIALYNVSQSGGVPYYSAYSTSGGLGGMLGKSVNDSQVVVVSPYKQFSIYQIDRMPYLKIKKSSKAIDCVVNVTATSEGSQMMSQLQLHLNPYSTSNEEEESEWNQLILILTGSSIKLIGSLSIFCLFVLFIRSFRRAYLIKKLTRRNQQQEFSNEQL